MAKILKVTTGGVPAGSYLARFTGYEETTTEYGDGLRWQFEPISGPYKGSKTSRITSQNPTMKNACGKILSGLIGKPLTPDQDIDLDSLIGKSYLIVVTNTETGGTRVDTVSPPPIG